MTFWIKKCFFFICRYEELLLLSQTRDLAHVIAYLNEKHSKIKYRISRSSVHKNMSQNTNWLSSSFCNALHSFGHFRGFTKDYNEGLQCNYIFMSAQFMFADTLQLDCLSWYRWICEFAIFMLSFSKRNMTTAKEKGSLLCFPFEVYSVKDLRIVDAILLMILKPFQKTFFSSVALK